MTGSKAVEKQPHTGSPNELNPGSRMLPLDGLRGIAICLVILFHADIGFDVSDVNVARLSSVAKCGWIGVDIFFVLSGFLITGILLDTRKSPKYLTSFYARRFIRIFPLYYATLLAVFVILPNCASIDSPKLQFLFTHQGYFWSFLSNVGYVIEQKAFGNADWLWLDHFWSLALEEQFYVVWPFVVLRASNRRIVQICLLMIFASLALRCSLAAYGMRPSGLYFPTPCRLDGLAVGAIAAVIRRVGIPLAWQGGTRAVVWCSAIILCGIAAARGGLRFDDLVCLTIGLTALAVVSGSIILWAATAEKGLGYQLLTHPTLRFMGKYSYGIYVLHHLLLPIIFYQIPSRMMVDITGSKLGAAVLLTTLTFAMSIASGVLSWHLLEKHFLKLKSQFSYSTSSSWK